MSETGASEALPPRPAYQPRHEVVGQQQPELDVGLLATIAAAVHVYLMQGREGASGAQTAETYHGRHRAEDKAQEAVPKPEPAPSEPEKASIKEGVQETEQNEPTPIFDRLQMEWGSQATRQASSAPPPQSVRLAHVITAQNLLPEPQPEPQPKVATEQAAVQSQPEHPKGLLGRLRHAWYAGMAAVTTYFTNPEKGRRRRILATSTALLGGAAAIGALLWLDGRIPDWQDQPGPVPSAAKPAGPPPNTEQFYDTLTPYGYRGEQYEWTAAANAVGPAQATPRLQHLIHVARDNGLIVDTWGSMDCGEWGIVSVTARLPDGTEKTYYDTPRKLALLQWYAGGMAPSV